MKVLRNVFFFILLLLFVDVARFFFLPDISWLAQNNPGKTAFMEYREAGWRREGVDRTIRQQWVPLKKVSPSLVKAVLISEDRNFWQHEGFDFDAIESAIEKNVKAGEFKFGASTISQQLSKNLYLSPSKNPLRKIKEAILTWRIERTLSKRRILELYVNIAEWGDGIYGIEEATRHYYGVSASQLTASQSSRLAAVLPNPIRYNPTGSSRFVRVRAARIYSVMLRRGLVVPDYSEVMRAPDTSGALSADSIVIGVPENLIREAALQDSTRQAPSAAEHTETLPQPVNEKKEQSGN
ncbi:MAG: monofunctional biosynthetic peptidoglycan transglycosylase [Chlorobiaceae bacterium]|nr:monofunctional biosynthetic peptidoglycan transglycosylase [Chlorobiaceae bacterium]